MKKQIMSFLAGAILIVCLGFTSQIQNVVFKPQKPASTYVQEFEDENVLKISQYINRRIKEGFVVKTIALSYDPNRRGVTGIVVMERY